MRHADEREPDVHQVETARRRLLRADVVDAYLHRRAGDRGEPAGVGAGDRHPSGRSDLPGEPGHHGDTVGADLPAAPAGPDADRFEMPERGGIEQIGEGVEVLRRLVLPVIERVPVGSHHAAITPVTRLVRLVRNG
jgi:hypothetical protein